MDDSKLVEIEAWLDTQGLSGTSETDLMNGFCARCLDAGIRLERANCFVDTLHPIYEGRVFLWRREGQVERAIIEYGSSQQGESADNWQSSTFYRMLQRNEDEMRQFIGQIDTPEFRHLVTLKSEGCTDYLALIHRFSSEGSIGEMDCFYSQWSTDAPDGFSEEELAAIRRLVRGLGLAIKCTSLSRIVQTLADVYLGHDAARRVLAGRINRGAAERMEAVLWYSDLRGYTRISDTAAPDEIIPMLNDYAEAVISSIHEAGGDVLKLIGDGTLAIFTNPRSAAACAAALKAERLLRKKLKILNQRRRAAGLPATDVYLGMHIGEVFYGNIGSDTRLDFTVVGPAVNEVSRIASMCRSVDQTVLVSDSFAAALPAKKRQALVSVGRFALRGVGRAQDLFTLERTVAKPAG
ncbi:adenylate/guanylate cyclase domain-containing protein [Phyllobacterium sp. 0TCS1.6C]|uniref:adenylate/guanylate cyclase domain-containing protein n=1 Tax=unclassified Phyllobacterium TaxID=2638441 RepID=UPI0022653A4B|nr:MULTISPECIES: adenylate/guanylate cyclase domain-containing protein [unclassified Phyllobacterium]MCX8282144.1 adenylate/guanylate cyclase domain-containing protein [Phyllobacterium sp. 0TCS1.6C]MCX8296352.1 adenylate/guanylate cyclase domain-containing protein [Phyllobacterium sp. 0TCS1.6A]